MALVPRTPSNKISGSRSLTASANMKSSSVKTIIVAVAMCLLPLLASSLPQEAKSEADVPPTAAGTENNSVVQTQREYPVRDLPADTLRDFNGVCFGSTTFRFYQVGDTWPLTPFCGIATCLTDGVHLIERVRDCGLLPKENPKCKITNASSRNETFPACCPQFQCEEGINLEYPTPEELQAFAQQAHQAQLAAAAARQPEPQQKQVRG